MVPLKTLFSLLAAGEFANMAVVKDVRGNIDESEYGKILQHINLAIIEIYKRFKFKEEELILCVDPLVSTYYLRPEHTEAPGNTDTVRYIEHPAGRNGSINLIEIKDVYDSNNAKVVMNNRFCIPYVKQVSADTLRITGLLSAEKLSVVFQSHPDVPVLNDMFNMNTYKLDIPSTIIEPILYYTAARVFRPTGANNSTANADKSSAYMQQYELACQKIDLYGLATQDEDVPTERRFRQEGWV